MSFYASFGVPTLCPCCGSPSASRWQVAAAWSRFSCPPCGGYRIDLKNEQAMAMPAPPALVGRFHTDSQGVRWLLAD